MGFTEAQLSAWLASYFWPFIRIGAMMAAAPIFSARHINMRFRLLLAVVVTLAAAPLLPKMPVVDAFSHEAFLIIVHQIGIGVMMGFTIQLVFGALIYGGQVLAYSMGLGFASMVDPLNGLQVPVVAQFYLIIATLLFLIVNGHLILIQMVVDSFQTLPVAVDGVTRNSLWDLVSWGSRMFAGGLLIALPVVASLLMVNIGMGVVTRAAPQFNIFAVGFPMTMTLGFIIIWLSLPNMMGAFQSVLEEAFDLVATYVNITP